MLPILCGASNIYGAGMLELGMSMSLEQLVIDNDVIGMIRFTKNGVDVNKDTLAYNSIKEVGIGNNFLGTMETMNNISITSMPKIIDRRMYDPWKVDGCKDTVDLAHEKVVEILKAPVNSPLTDAQAKAINDLIEKRNKELSA